jgi:aminomuconate-semialdehyde/2-hydroxymuconate-6-semialdehyde dehydrogenase
MSVTKAKSEQLSMSLEQAFASKKFDHFIGGRFVASQNGETFEDTNPATGEVIALVASGNAADVDKAVGSAREAFEKGPWPKMSVGDRCAALKKVGDLILQYRDLLAKAETLDTGKPITESFEGDIPRSAQNFHFFAQYAQSVNDECYTVGDNERHFAVREPLGVVALITPWNLPLYLATWKIAPCLAMGNTCVLKPAEWTPYTAYLLCHIFKEAGIPDGVFNVVHGFGAGSAGEALTRHPDVSAISFTGETTTGKAIMQAAAGTLKKVSFELGGKGANIIFDDADLDEAVPTAVRAAYRNQGQICLAGSRLFVQQGVYKEVLSRMVELVKAIKVGDPLDPKTQMGAIISKEQMEKVEGYISLGKKEGKLLTGGERISQFPKGNFLSPSLFCDLGYDTRFCQEEIFGPVLPVIPFKTDQEVIDMTNSTPYGLSSSLWSKDVDRCHRLSRKIKTGIVWVNCWFARDLRTPFGGQKASGIGREGGKHALDFFSESKTICYRYKG